MVVIKILGTPFSLLDTPLYLKGYDLEANEGRGWVQLTHTPDNAQRFASKGAAMQAWLSQSVMRPLRPDGLPNRPLCAYSVEFEAYAPPAPQLVPAPLEESVAMAMGRAS